jgi:hypothetical protein
MGAGFKGVRGSGKQRRSFHAQTMGDMKANNKFVERMQRKREQRDERRTKQLEQQPTNRDQPP